MNLFCDSDGVSRNNKIYNYIYMYARGFFES